MRRFAALPLLFVGFFSLLLVSFCGKPLHAYESGGATVTTPATAPVDLNGQNLLNVGDVTGINFADLDDVPASYTGQAGLCAKVNPGETALIYGTCGGGGGDNLGDHTATQAVDLAGYSLLWGNEGAATNVVSSYVDSQFLTGLFGPENQMVLDGGSFLRGNADRGILFGGNDVATHNLFRVIYSAGDYTTASIEGTFGGTYLGGGGPGVESLFTVEDAAGNDFLKIDTTATDMDAGAPVMRGVVTLGNDTGEGSAVVFPGNAWIGSDVGGVLNFASTGSGIVPITDLINGGFTDLTDAPASYTGHGGKVVAVKMAEDGVEFINAPGDDLGSHVATADLDMDSNNVHSIGRLFINAPVMNGFGIASNPTLVGAFNTDEQYGFYNSPTFTSASTGRKAGVFHSVAADSATSELLGDVVAIDGNSHANTLAAGVSVSLTDLTNTTTAYGVHVEEITGAGTNYSIYTAGNTDSFFGGDVTADSFVGSGASLTGVVDSSLCTSARMYTSGGGYYPMSGGTCFATKHNLGTYKKIDVTGYILWNGGCVGTCTGNLSYLSFELTGYNANSTTNYRPPCTIFIGNVTYTDPAVGLITENTDEMSIYQVSSGAATPIAVDSMGDIRVSCSYHQ